MNCPSCNFKNIEENRFCIMCGTPLEGGGAPSDTTGSLDLSASLPGGADIDFSGLMDQVADGSTEGLFDGLDDAGGGKDAGGGSLDLMLSDFEGNLAALTDSAEAPAAGEGVPPPSGGEGWGGEDFSFSDLGNLDPNSKSDDIPVAGGGSAQGAAMGGDDPLDFSFSSDALGGGLDFGGLEESAGGAGGADASDLFGGAPTSEEPVAAPAAAAPPPAPGDGGGGGGDLDLDLTGGADLFGGESVRAHRA